MVLAIQVSPPPEETTRLLRRGNAELSFQQRKGQDLTTDEEPIPVLHRRRPATLFISVTLATLLLAALSTPIHPSIKESSSLRLESIPLLQKKHRHHKYNHKHKAIQIPNAEKRCEWVIDQFNERDAPPNELEKRHRAQAVDVNVFYRATAKIFWRDFVDSWGGNLTEKLLLTADCDTSDGHGEVVNIRGIPLDAKSTWTWVTGDQHLSNFGAWRNRDNDVVFGVNDFDEAAIYDFQIDVLRITVSVCNHAVTNGLPRDEVDKALSVFLKRYVDTVIGYVGNEDALLYELTPETATGTLAKFLNHVRRHESPQKQMTKFTEVDANTGRRHFLKGPVDVPHHDTNLAAVPPIMEQEIRDAFSSTRYGSTMMKLGWAVHSSWDDAFFEVLDVAERVGSGVGSFGVDRYYVLLQGTDGLLGADGQDGSAVILDVKYQPESAVTKALESHVDDATWYKSMFPNEAARVVEAQRRLTSYTDPFTGWVMLKQQDPNDPNFGLEQPFSIRQRSPWKDSPDLDYLTDPDDFNEFMSQIAAATATSHVRGTVAKSPGAFKQIIWVLFESDEDKLERWVSTVTRLAHAYREQVLLDYDCFHQFVQEHYGIDEDSG